ncbi:MAG: extracellular solute-binding protein [Verrucomicrobia bacterium]|nr:extracellular solute-binding protein [Verrucomicrobiota bacterium]
MKHHQHLSLLFASVALVILLTSCGKNSDSEFEAYDNSQDMADHFAEHPDFFRFLTPDDLPTDLEWEDGMDLPEIGSPKAKKGGTFRRRIQDFPRTLRLIGPDSNGSFRGWILDYNFMQYAHRHPNYTEVKQGGFYFFPGVAKEWALDYAGKQVFIKINPDARWSDGEPITTEDVAFAFYFYQKDYHKQIWYNDWYKPGVNYSHVTVYDEHTFAVGLQERRPNMLNLVLELVPLPRHFYNEYGPDYNERYQWRSVTTSGPYIVKDSDIKKGRSIILSRHKDWWAKDLKFWRYRFNYDRMRFEVIRDSAKAFESFLRGDIDAVKLNLPEYWYDKLPNDSPLITQGYINKYQFYNDKPRPTYGLWINSSKPLLNNRDIRVGINYATNWDLVCEQYFRGDADRMRTSADGYGPFTHPTLKARPFDTDKALEAFAKAGFTKRGPDGVLVNDLGQRLSFDVSTGYESLKDVLTILREEALKAGLEFRVGILEATTAWKKVQEKKHEIHFVAFGVSPEMYPRYKETYHSERAYENAWTEDGQPNPDRKPKTQSNNLQLIAYKELDVIIEAYDNSESVDEMISLAMQMEEFLAEDASFVPGFVLPTMRVGAWRWIDYPEEFSVKISGEVREYRLDWIDEEKKKETLEAMKKGRTFDPVIKTIKKYAPKSN